MNPFDSVVSIGDDPVGMGFVVETGAVVTATHVVSACMGEPFQSDPEPVGALVPVRPFKPFLVRAGEAKLYRLAFADLVSDVAVLVSCDVAPLGIARPLKLRLDVPSDGDLLRLRIPTSLGRIARYRAQAVGPSSSGLYGVHEGGPSIVCGTSGAPVIDHDGHVIAVVSSKIVVSADTDLGPGSARFGASWGAQVEAFFALTGRALPPPIVSLVVM